MNNSQFNGTQKVFFLFLQNILRAMSHQLLTMVEANLNRLSISWVRIYESFANQKFMPWPKIPENILARIFWIILLQALMNLKRGVVNLPFSPTLSTLSSSLFWIFNLNIFLMSFHKGFLPLLLIYRSSKVYPPYIPTLQYHILHQLIIHDVKTLFSKLCCAVHWKIDQVIVRRSSHTFVLLKMISPSGENVVESQITWTTSFLHSRTKAWLVAVHDVDDIMVVTLPLICYFFLFFISICAKASHKKWTNTE